MITLLLLVKLLNAIFIISINQNRFHPEYFLGYLRIFTLIRSSILVVVYLVFVSFIF